MLRCVPDRDDGAGCVPNSELVDDGAEARVLAAGPVLGPDRESMLHLGFRFQRFDAAMQLV